MSSVVTHALRQQQNPSEFLIENSQLFVSLFYFAGLVSQTQGFIQ